MVDNFFDHKAHFHKNQTNVNNNKMLPTFWSSRKPAYYNVRQASQIMRAYHLLYRRARFTLNRRPVTCLIAGTLFLAFLYLLFFQLLFPSENGHQEEQHRAYDSGLAGLSASSRCAPMSANTLVAYTAFLRALLLTLDRLAVGHFLCYESLWRVLRAQQKEGKRAKQKQLRLADGCLSLCVLNEDLMRHEEALVERRFRNAGITLKYNHGDGLYLLTPSTAIFKDAFGGDGKGEEEGALHPELFTLHARVHVFEADPRTDEYRRVGWKHRLLPPTMCNQLHCFPPNLVERPLPLVKLPVVGVTVSVPKEGVEMLKYQYPESWWKVQSADDCAD